MDIQAPDPAVYSRRIVDNELDDLIEQLPAILLDGAKGVGKTATALQRCASVRRLDTGLDSSLIAANPNIIAKDLSPVLIDEWQLLPHVWDTIRRLVDDKPVGGQFILTGSAPGRTTHSGAGRITTIRMRPLCLFERYPNSDAISFSSLLQSTNTKIEGQSEMTLERYVHEIISGGFPGMRHLSDRALTRQLDSYIDRIVDHDIREVGFVVRRPATLKAWLRAYAASTATTTSWDKIRNAATSGIDDKPAKTTTVEYTELLTSLRIFDPLDAWLPTKNHLRSLNSAPKHHLVDPALAARLLRRNASDLISTTEQASAAAKDGNLLGRLFESFVALSIRSYAQSCDATVNHLRTKGGQHEVDFIVESDGGVLALEAKIGPVVTDDDVSNLIWLRAQLGDNCIDTVVVTTGHDAYRRPDGVAVIPLDLLGL